MTNSESELWNNIRTFQFDKPNVRLTFAKRLAKEHAISQDFANQIIDEYRKFIFLCCVSGEQIAPSHFVDLAWHLHLTYTRSYWIELCRNTIHRDLHHNPTEGGREEDSKFKNLYKRTLKQYELYFSCNAPNAVWPKENEEPEKQTVEIEKNRYWIIPKPVFGFDRPKNLLPIAGIIFIASMLGCSSVAESLPVAASPGFVVFAVIACLGIVVLMVFLVRRSSREKNGDSDSGSGCGSIFGSSDSGDCGDGGDGGGDSGCSSGCSGGCGGGD